ncbi:hypothetical protein [Hyalangium rubrum]|uniref:Uncharacterized protein n=1 Tax=Hyalangium rubrum TaxID=3103134 RepID=A0ABU5GX76_9BACT|nr:hypothetical protein [Hyalangium sp. s54d21]MDY7225147.1 hypothetical protein [Hyalangium sp. s54d21]
MPRSYSFDHFQVPASEPRSRSMRRQDKQHLADSRHSHPEQDGGVHYGKSHAETEEILKARAAMRREAPEVSDDVLPEEPPIQAAPRVESPAATPRLNRNTQPIGALPMTEELPPRGRFQDLLDEASRQLEAIQGGIGDVTKAATRLASLPVEVVRLAARRLRLVHG